MNSVNSHRAQTKCAEAFIKTSSQSCDMNHTNTIKYSDEDLFIYIFNEEALEILSVFKCVVDCLEF